MPASKLTPSACIDDIVAWLRQVAPGAQLFSDSRSMTANTVFVAYPGDESDGRSYIAQAIAQGAAAVLYQADDPAAKFAWNPAWEVPCRAVPDLKKLAGHIASAYYGQPDAGMATVAVTGTNGKTSCALWIASALSRLGSTSAAIGTLGIGMFKKGLCDAFTTTGYTTPDAVLLQQNLAQLRDSGVAALAIEASSIGLDQGRLNGMHVDIALFTNFTHDHLDYHGDMSAYEVAKTLLFDWSGLQHAVVNLDDAMGMRLAQRYQGQLPVIGYTVGESMVDGVPVLRAHDIRTRHAGSEFRLDSPFGTAQVKTHLVGSFNVSNVLGVLGVLLAKGVAIDAAIGAIEALQPAPGRMQQLGGPEAPMVVIDYAHTPDALEKTLATLRHVANEREGKLWCVFGCGGDRDPGKRPVMGAIAETADHVLVTSDNPRSENPHRIIEQIIAGMKTTPQAIDDRAAAILSAVKHAERNDVILIAGKGHETSQEVMGKKHPFSDADHAALALAARVTMKRAS